jgi:hypothetical protein
MANKQDNKKYKKITTRTNYYALDKQSQFIYLSF